MPTSSLHILSAFFTMSERYPVQCNKRTSDPSTIRKQTKDEAEYI
jgi:hypothetical protein